MASPHNKHRRFLFIGLALWAALGKSIPLTWANSQALTGSLIGTIGTGGAPHIANLPPTTPQSLLPADEASLPGGDITLSAYVDDPDSPSLGVSFVGRKLLNDPPEPFRIVVLPDTQYYSENHPEIFLAQTEWIANHRDTLNIAYVAHEGDLVQDAYRQYQWENADDAISVLETLPDLPFGLCVGNHDQNPSGDPDGTDDYNTWFPYTRFESRAWYGGHYGTDNDNHYILFTAGGLDFIAIHMEYDRNPTETLAWAADLLQTYADRLAIVVAHSLLDLGTPASWTTQGSATYDALKVYPNLFLMLCGHNHGQARRTDFYMGNKIESLLADYQDYPNGGNGWLRILEFVPADNEIHVTTYSPTLDQYQTDNDSQFTLTYDMGGASFAPIETFSNVPADSDAIISWNNLEPEYTYEWYVTASDGIAESAGPIRRFSTYTDGPAIGLAPDSFEHTSWILRPIANDTFTVANTALDTLNYTIADDADWLSVSPASGASTGQADTITIAYDTSALPVGDYVGTVTITDDNAWNSPQTIAVTLHIRTITVDFDQDGDVDLTDFGHLQSCLTGSYITPSDPECADANFAGNSGIDQSEIDRFRQCFSGADILAAPECLD